MVEQCFKYISKKSVLFYMLALSIVSILFFSQILPFDLLLFGILSILLFFYGGSNFYSQTKRMGEHLFEKKLLKFALLIRIVYVLFIYFYNNSAYGTYYESNGGDIEYYVHFSKKIVSYIHEGYSFSELLDVFSHSFELSDSGYVLYLAFLYLVTADVSWVILPLLLKALMGAYVCLFVYKTARRFFDEPIARLSGILCAVQFNLIWWCGSMMKETEMLFLLMFFIERASLLLTTRQTNKKIIFQVIALALSLFLFRTVLGFIAFFALFVGFLFSPHKSKNEKKKSIIVIAFLTILVAGPMLYSEFMAVKEVATKESYQETNMEWRAEREGGNQFAKYAGAAVFAPLIFTIPFPTMAYTNLDQEMQMQVNGGFFEKNILSFFVIFVMFYLLKQKRWKPYSFLIALLCSYLLALVFSVFAQSGRFHMLIIPLEIIFAVYGMTLMNAKRLKYFDMALFAEVVFCVGWAWFKLAGRGLV